MISYFNEQIKEVGGIGLYFATPTLFVSHKQEKGYTPILVIQTTLYFALPPDKGGAPEYLRLVFRHNLFKELVGLLPTS